MRTWWRSRPDDDALKDTDLEVVSEHLGGIGGDSCGPFAQRGGAGLMGDEDGTARSEFKAYFAGGKVVQVDRGGYFEGQQVPKASVGVVTAAVEKAVADGDLWLVSGPTSLFKEDYSRRRAHGCEPVATSAGANCGRRDFGGKHSGSVERWQSDGGGHAVAAVFTARQARSMVPAPTGGRWSSAGASGGIGQRLGDVAVRSVRGRKGRAQSRGRADHMRVQAAPAERYMKRVRPIAPISEPNELQDSSRCPDRYHELAGEVRNQDTV